MPCISEVDIKHLQATTGTTSNGGAYTEVRAPEGVATEIDDVKGWCHVVLTNLSP